MDYLSQLSNNLSSRVWFFFVTEDGLLEEYSKDPPPRTGREGQGVQGGDVTQGSLHLLDAGRTVFFYYPGHPQEWWRSQLVAFGR